MPDVRSPLYTSSVLINMDGIFDMGGTMRINSGVGEGDQCNQVDEIILRFCHKLPVYSHSEKNTDAEHTVHL